MTSTQKVVKYLAMAFGLFLGISIISAILIGIYSVGASFFGESPKMEETKEVYNANNFQYQDIEVDVKATNIFIKEGESFTIETNNKFIETQEKENKLIIKDNSKNNFRIKAIDTELLITVPENYLFNSFDLEIGAGEVNIDMLKTNTLSLDLGAGSLYLNNTNVNEKAKINTGAGKVRIEKDTTINNLNLDLGTGKFAFQGILLGDNKIECGVGSSTFEIKGKKEDYRLKVDKGVGSITINNEKVSGNSTIGDGENTIDIDGGVGSIKVNFQE